MSRYFFIRETLEECEEKDIFSADCPYVVILSPKEWDRDREKYPMVIDMESEISSMAVTKAVVNYSSLTGIIVVPKMGYEDREVGSFKFALDEHGIVFIDESGLAEKMTMAVAGSKKWKFPSLERFLYDFLEQIISKDLEGLGMIEVELENLEKKILEGSSDKALPRLNKIRGRLLNMDLYYSQLVDLGQELEENENDFFSEENLRYFTMFSVRVERLGNMVTNLKDHAVQLRDLIQTRVDVKQNRIMTLLTVVTTIFAPLTLITGWYGMNFKHMPELEYTWSYPAVFIISLVIAVGCLWYFKKKDWM